MILESTDLGTEFMIPAARDLDSAENGVRRYELSAQSSKFDLMTKNRLDGSTDVKLVLKENLDREKEDKFEVWSTILNLRELLMLWTFTRLKKFPVRCVF